MTTKSFPLMLIAVVIAVMGELLLKTAMNAFGVMHLEPRTIPRTVWSLATNPLILTAMAAYAVSVFLWLAVLSRLELSYAYPWWALGFVLVTLASQVLLHEAVPPLRYLGVAVICLGLVILARA